MKKIYDLEFVRKLLVKSAVRLTAGISASFLLACGQQKLPTFSLLPGEESFKQQSVIDNKLDVLWVVDNSGSMANLQANVGNNFSAFIGQFLDNNYDFQMAVTTTDAWRAPFLADPSMAAFKDGAGGTHSGFFVLTPDTPDLIDNFLINITQGISGYGDERPFQSMMEALNSPLNSGFLRENAFLAVILVTDEEDFSHDTEAFSGEDYDFPGLHTVDSYIDQLANLKSVTTGEEIFSVSGIAIQDNDCLDENDPWGNIATRVGEIVEKTNGVLGNVCSENFAETLDDIQNRIAELSTQFLIDREFIPGTLGVTVDGVKVFESTSNGWSYNPETHIMQFHGESIPAQGAAISVNFEPVTIK